MKVSSAATESLVRWGAVIAVVALLGAGCSSSSSGGKPNPQKITAANLCEEYAQAVCYNMWNCCTGKEIETILGQTLTTTEGKCQDDMKLQCENNLAPILDAVNNNRASINSTSAAKCLDGLILPDTNSCFIEPTDNSLELNITTNCAVALQGQVAAGGDCFNSFECVTDTTCEGTVDGSAGKCISKIGSGETCYYYSLNDCKENLYCASTATTSTGPVCSFVAPGCACAALKAENAPCCNTNECATDLYCVPPATGVCSLATTGGNPGSCKAPVAAGQPCTNSTPCVTNYSCQVGVCQINNKLTCATDTDCSDVTAGDTCSGRFCVLDRSLQNFCTVLNNFSFLMPT